MSVFSTVVMVVGAIMAGIGLSGLMIHAAEDPAAFAWSFVSYVLTILGLYLMYETMVIA